MKTTGALPLKLIVQIQNAQASESTMNSATFRAVLSILAHEQCKGQNPECRAIPTDLKNAR